MIITKKSTKMPISTSSKVHVYKFGRYLKCNELFMQPMFQSFSHLSVQKNAAAIAFMGKTFVVPFNEKFSPLHISAGP